jgi:hypothetical protein
MNNTLWIANSMDLRIKVIKFRSQYFELFSDSMGVFCSLVQLYTWGVLSLLSLQKL